MSERGEKKLTKAQIRVLCAVSAGQSISGHVDTRVARRLKSDGLILHKRSTPAFNTIFAYYDLTPAGRTALKEGDTP